MKAKKRFIILLIFIHLILLIIIYHWLFYTLGPVMVLSVSSDGQYVISSNQNKSIILWDIKNKTSKILSKNGNVYSAYFIKNTHNFMWQDLEGFVHIQNVKGKTLRIFYNLPVYGEVMTSDLKQYIASNEKWGIFEGININQKPIKLGESGFFGAGKLLNLTLSDDNKYLLTSGFGSDWDKEKLYTGKNELKRNYHALSKISLMDGVVLWNVQTGKPIQKFSGNAAKTFATLSQDNNYIVSGDEQPRAFVWKRFPLELKFRLLELWDHRFIQPPDEFKTVKGYKTSQILAVKFIDTKGHYLRFTTYVPYAVLYSVENPMPLKFLSLGTKPFPSINDYSRDESIDTAPKVNILVMGKQDGGGIIVYKFNPKTFFLHKIWVS